MRRIKDWYAARHPTSGVSPHAPPWFIMCGPRGIGKSTAAAYVLARQRGVYTTMPLMLADYSAWKKSKPEERHKTAFAKLRQSGAVVLDEVGTEKDHEAELAREAMFAFVNGRQSHRTDTLVLTNMTGQQMADRIRSGTYDERTHPRLQALAVLVGFKGESLRKVVAGGGL
jgi:DNA replication protein DnaC